MQCTYTTPKIPPGSGKELPIRFILSHQRSFGPLPLKPHRNTNNAKNTHTPLLPPILIMSLTPLRRRLPKRLGRLLLLTLPVAVSVLLPLTMDLAIAWVLPLRLALSMAVIQPLSLRLSLPLAVTLPRDRTPRSGRREATMIAINVVVWRTAIRFRPPVHSAHLQLRLRYVRDVVPLGRARRQYRACPLRVSCSRD